LTAIGLQLEGALTLVDESPRRARERLQRALDVSRESLEEARRSVLDLRAMPLVGRPLAEALAALGRRFTSETGIRVHVRAPAGGELPLRTEAELLRIAQEALMNIRKHAMAGEVEVTLRRAGGRLHLSIRDDGRGFSVRKRSDAGVGILGMHERARVLEGRLRVESHLGRGTTVLASVPIGARAE